jgi:hypothetical protein
METATGSAIPTMPVVEQTACLTAEKLIELLQKLPKDAKVATFIEPDLCGSYYIQDVSYDRSKNRITLAVPEPTTTSEPNDCDEMDRTNKWYDTDSDEE